MFLTDLEGHPVTVGDTPTPLRKSNDFAGELLIRNNSAVVIYVGDVNVSITTGTPIDPGDVVTVELVRGVQIYGIVASETADVRVLEGHV